MSEPNWIWIHPTRNNALQCNKLSQSVGMQKDDRLISFFFHLNIAIHFIYMQMCIYIDMKVKNTVPHLTKLLEIEMT